MEHKYLFVYKWESYKFIKRDMIKYGKISNTIIKDENIEKAVEEFRRIFNDTENTDHTILNIIKIK